MAFNFGKPTLEGDPGNVHIFQFLSQYILTFLYCKFNFLIVHPICNFSILDIGPVIGGSIGALAILIVVLLIGTCCYKCHNKNGQHSKIILLVLQINMPYSTALSWLEYLRWKSV